MFNYRTGVPEITTAGWYNHPVFEVTRDLHKLAINLACMHEEKL
jgi:hypothetical protein